MDQSALQGAVQTVIRNLSDFSNADVVINDYSILDGPVSNAPYVIIENVLTANITEGMGGVEQGELELPFGIYEPFVDWETTLNNLRNREDAVVNGFNGDDWSANGMSGVSIQFVRLDNTIEIHDPAAERSISDPVYVMRPVVLQMELF